MPRTSKEIYAEVVYRACVRKCPRQSKGIYADVVCLWDVCSQAPKRSKAIDADVACACAVRGALRVLNRPSW